ncbi:DNA starvation/stationary phase protection protein [bacterium]|nr:DNA starvation/stationary phase protection protein [bacterium]
MPAIAKKKPTIALQRTRHPLPETQRVEVVRALAPLQTGSIELYLQLKNAHWNVRGNAFGSLHRIFDETSQELSEIVDNLAERMAIVGGEPLATIQKLTAVPQLADAPTGMRAQEEFIKLVVDRLSYYIQLVRDSIDVFERYNDRVTADACVRACSALEKKLWMIESHSVSKA